MKKIIIILLTLHVSLFTLHPSEAQIIHVPADFPTIQEGIAAASNGDTVLVDTGLYYENIDFLGKPLIVASNFLIDGDANHINNTIINGSQPDDPNWGSVVIMQNGEDSTSVLCGFTITGGTGTLVVPAGNARFGGGVFLANGGKVINNNIEYNIVTNSYWAAGGGVWMGGGPGAISLNCVLRSNRIAYNKAISDNDEGTGGGVACLLDLIMEDNEIIFNEASGSYRGDGGGVNISGVWGHIDLEIRNNKIKYNKAASKSEMTDIVLGGGIDIFDDCSGIVAGNEISFNSIEVYPGRQSYGAGVMIEEIPGTDFVFENNFVRNNTFTGTHCLGGGVLIYNGLCNFRNNVVQNNTATHGGGVGVGYNTDKHAIIINNTITGNTSDYGGGLYGVSADAVVINTIIWGNTADSSGLSIYEDNCKIPVVYSDVEGDDYWPGEGNENIDPGFGDDGYHLGDASPVWNEGIFAIVVNEITYTCPEYDIDWEPRPFDGQDPDIGADETPSIHISVEESSVGSRQSSVECYPNPTSGIVDFRLSMVDGRWVSLKIYDVQGREVAVVLAEALPAGEHTVTWDATALPAGIYYYRLAVGGQRSAANGKIVKY